MIHGLSTMDFSYLSQKIYVMEFGRVNPEELFEVDFNLPPDPELTIATLKASKNDQPLQVHVGCAKWGRKEWLGKIYPLKTKEANFCLLYTSDAADDLLCVDL